MDDSRFEEKSRFKAFKKCWNKYVTPCLDWSSAFHDKHCMTVWSIVLVGGVACVVGWVFLNR